MRHPDYEKPSGQVTSDMRYQMQQVTDEINSLKLEVVAKLNSILPGTDALMVWKLSGSETEIAKLLLDVVGQYSGNQFLKPAQSGVENSTVELPKSNGHIQPPIETDKKVVSQDEFLKLWTKPPS
jgi:hypothetical protein